MKDLLAYFDPGDSMIELAILWLLQTSILILLAAACVRGLLYRRPEARHALWFSVLVLVLVSPAIAAATSESRFALWAIELPARWNAGDVAVAGQRPSDESAHSNPPPPVAGSPTDSIAADDEPLNAARILEGHASGPAVISPVTRLKASHRDRALIEGLTLAWLVGALIGLARIGIAWKRLAALIRSASALDSQHHGSTLARVRDALGVAALPPVVTSPGVRAPVACGLSRPRIILPEGLAESLTTDSLRDVLIHECAHIVRGDAWIALFQRLVAVIFWPNPLVYYASAQLTRAREETCDNYVLRCGDPRGYARTLLALTERCLPMGAERPQLGVFGTRWTLADRIAGLLDTRRVPMTRTTFRMRIGVWVLLAVMGMGAGSVRISPAARAEGAQAKPAEPHAGATRAVWSVEGTVVDERGHAVAGAVVRAVANDRPDDGSKTAADGTFALPLGGRCPYITGVVAESDGGERIGLVRFENARELGETDPVRVIVKPSRPVRVRVNDAAGLPVPGATVEAIDLSFQTHTTTGLDGTATLRVPADAKVRFVIGKKAGAGFDYLENYRTRPAADYPPLPADVSLTLDGAETVRLKAVDSKGQPVSGVEFGLGPLSKSGKVSHAGLRRSAAAKATTDRLGFATFDWLPKGGAGATFHVATGGEYTTRVQPLYRRGGPARLTVHLLRDTRLSGTVRYPDGRPAPGILIKAEGGPRSGASIDRAARTLADGTYVLDAPSESSYIVAVVDETWAAPSLSNIIVREGLAQGGLDFTLTKGTLLHGQVSEAPDHRPAVGAFVWLTEEGGPVEKDLRRSGFHSAERMQRSTADAQGRYHFRIGPGRYSLRSPHAGGTEPLTVEVKNEAEIVRDIALAGSVRETYFSGVVLEKTPTGDRPVAGAVVRRLRGAFNQSTSRSIADHQGRFRMLRVPGEQTLYGVSPDRSLAGMMPLPVRPDNVRLVISKAPELTGRVVDANGRPQTQRGVLLKIDSGPDASRSLYPVGWTGTDDQGRFKVLAAPVGSYVEVSVPYPRTPNLATPRIVVSFRVSDTDPIVIPDLVVPAEKPAK